MPMSLQAEATLYFDFTQGYSQKIHFGCFHKAGTSINPGSRSSFRRTHSKMIWQESKPILFVYESFMKMDDYIDATSTTSKSNMMSSLIGAIGIVEPTTKLNPAFARK